MNRPNLRSLTAAILFAACLMLAGCASMSAHLPWTHKAPRPPEISAALTIASPDGAPSALPQYWQRNAVVVDLSGVSGTGSAVVMPRSGLAWPVRMALRVTPGSVGSVEARGAQRLVLAVPASGSSTVDIQLPPGVYVAATKQMTLSWGPASTPTAP